MLLSLSQASELVKTSEISTGIEPMAFGTLVICGSLAHLMVITHILYTATDHDQSC